MKPLPRRATLLGAAVLMAVGLAGWSYTALRAAHHAAATASADLFETQRLARQVQTWRAAPRQADAGELELSALSQRIEAAAEAAGVSRTQLERIWPQPAQRLGDSVYLRHACQVVVRHITLTQAVTLLHTLSREADSLNVDALRLTAPRTPAPRSNPGSTPGSVPGSVPGSNPASTAETWTLEATLSYLVYAPANPASAISITSTAADTPDTTTALRETP